MNMAPSNADLKFRIAFESGEFPAADFHHKDHLRLAYVYLCDFETLDAFRLVKEAIKRFLESNGVPADKYHETITFAWVQAVRHFMERCESAASFEEFLNNDIRLLDAKIMLSHYKQGTLFSDMARREFVNPDLQPIPQYSTQL